MPFLENRLDGWAATRFQPDADLTCPQHTFILFCNFVWPLSSRTTGLRLAETTRIRCEDLESVAYDLADRSMTTDWPLSVDRQRGDEAGAIDFWRRQCCT